MSPFLQTFLAWIAQHPTWAGIAILLISLSESLLIVGLVVPGVIMMFGIGALVATGALQLWPALTWAVAGAVAGDTLSYWIGYHYQGRLRALWPFSRYPQMLERGENFFQRHGGKSIVFGRFVGPVRPVIPAVAGMLRMKPTRFLAANILSALAWAPAYILPGVVFGASLGLASQVATRLAAIAVILLLLFWFTLWGVRTLVNFIQPRADRMVATLSSWSNTHPRLGAPVAALFDPTHPESSTLLTLAALLGLATWTFVLFLNNVASGGFLSYVDRGVFMRVRDLRTPWTDSLMVLFSQFGDITVLLPVFAAVMLWLLVRRHHLAAAHWAAAVALGALITWAMTHGLPVPRPPQTYPSIPFHAVPSAHAALSTVVYGFLAVMIAHGLPPSRRWLPYACASLLVASIGLSRIYLGAHWVSDVFAGLLLGLAWVTVLASAYRHHQTAPVPLPGLVLTALLSLSLGAWWHISHHHAEDLLRYAVRHHVSSLTTDAWRHGEWQRLPAYRLELIGEVGEPLTVQWAGPLDRVREYLEERGWSEPVPLSWRSAMVWFTSKPRLEDLPLLPKVHDGRHEALVLVRAMTGSNRQMVLRLWPGNVLLKDGEQPLWLGFVAYQEMKHPFKLLALVNTERDFDAPLRDLRAELAGLDPAMVHRPPPSLVKKLEWNGAVLLLRGP
jgi:membrane protein DedA with SNARE-associated domain/membrane-associated phospholipid phosphatase